MPGKYPRDLKEPIPVPDWYHNKWKPDPNKESFTSVGWLFEFFEITSGSGFFEKNLKSNNLWFQFLKFWGTKKLVWL
jgi:hypothetical protein